MCTSGLLESESESRSVLTNSLWPYSLWNSLGQNTGVGCHSLLQAIFPNQKSNWGLLHCWWILSQLSYQGSLRLETLGFGVWLPDVNPNSAILGELLNFSMILYFHNKTLSMLLGWIKWDSTNKSFSRFWERSNLQEMLVYIIILLVYLLHCWILEPLSTFLVNNMNNIALKTLPFFSIILIYIWK